MDSNSAAIVSAVVSALVGFSGIAYSVREARRTRREQREETNNPLLARIEAEAWDRARDSWREAIREFEARATRAEARAQAAETEARSARRAAEKCEQKLVALRRWLRAQQIPVPAYFDTADYDDG